MFEPLFVVLFSLSHSLSSRFYLFWPLIPPKLPFRRRFVVTLLAAARTDTPVSLHTYVRHLKQLSATSVWTSESSDRIHPMQTDGVLNTTGTRVTSPRRGRTSREPCELQAHGWKKRAAKSPNQSEMDWRQRPAPYSAVYLRWAGAARQYGGYEGYKEEKSIFRLSRSSEFTKADNVTECRAYTSDCARTHNRASTHKHTSRQ